MRTAPVGPWIHREAKFLIAIRCTLLIFAVLIGSALSESSCDFEQLADCRWYFANSRELERIVKVQRLSPLAQPPPVIHFQGQRALSRQQSTRDFDIGGAATATGELGSHRNNFYVVVSGEGNISNHYAYYVAKRRNDDVAMIVSPFYERTATKCELHFRHRVLGERGSELLVTTEHMTLYAASNFQQQHHSEAEDEDWTRPTLRAHYSPFGDGGDGSTHTALRGNKEPWTTSRVPLGAGSYPTRVRIECHASGDDSVNAVVAGGNEDGDAGDGDLNVECHVDDIRLVDCDEVLYSDVVDCSGEDRFQCRSSATGPHHRQQLCLRYDELCDMHEQCVDGEDELDDLHHCSLIPTSAKCDFDVESTSSPVGCYGWRLFSGSSNSSMRELNTSSTTSGGQQHLISLMTSKDAATKGVMPFPLPPREYSYGGSTHWAGGYLFFSTYGHIGASEHEIVYSYALSPRFPPLNEGNSKCFLRFFYCRTGSSPFQIFQVSSPAGEGSKSGPQRLRQEHSRPVWSSADDDESTSIVMSGDCEWRRAAVQLWSAQQSDAEGYKLKLSFAKIAGSLGAIAIDDLSLTPGCFEGGAPSQSSALPTVAVNLTSCGSIGPDPPPPLSGDSNCTSSHEWTVPAAGFYQIYLFGASGGSLPGQRLHNGGGVVAANVRLKAGDLLQFVVGKRGESPCDGVVDGYDTARRPMSSRMEGVLESLCVAEPDDDGDSDGEAHAMQDGDGSSLVGTGGGGATALLINGRLAMVAGGGGGAFPEALHLAAAVADDADPGAPEGGHVFEDLSMMVDSSRSQPNDVEITAAEWTWVAGEGAFLGATQPRLNGESCHDCDVMSGRVENATHVNAGTCPPARLWSVGGGWGGGGASCGPGGGGGAGHRGGAPGQRAYGAGGSSAMLVPSPSVLSHPGYNRNASGYALVYACSQAGCPSNSTCEFDEPAIPSHSSALPPPSMYCLCVLTGERIPLLGRAGSCSDPNSPALLRWALRHMAVSVAIAICVLLVALVLLLIGAQRWWSSSGRRHRRSIAKLLRISETSSSAATADATHHGSIHHQGDKIAGNPIYESVQLAPLTTGLNSACPLPTIPRHLIQLERIIGHGAFGEVYSGYYAPGDEGTSGALSARTEDGGLRFKVAVKSLPDCSASDALEDFEREARLLSQFKHANIVTFFGVCFEQQPRYIVLEHLEGGDLKNFLRECRPNAGGGSGEEGAATKGGGCTPALGMIDLVQMALDVARGCEHLEVSKFVHRDIAARNCLLTGRDRAGRLVKIADFGMARDIYRNDYYRKGGRAFLPVRWMPPEAFLDGIFTTKTDVWSFGVLLWEIFSLGYVPYSGRENHEVMKLVVAGDRLDPPVGVLAEVYDVMLACWNTEALKRPRFYDLVEFFLQLLKREDLMAEPLPPVRHRLALSNAGAGEGRSSTTPSTRTQDSCQLGETLDFNASSIATTPSNNNPSQTTVSTLLGSTTSTAATGTTGGSQSSSAATYDSMPTAGSGVCRGVFPPYEPRIADPLMKMGPTPMILHRDSSFTAGSGASSSSSGSNRCGSQDEDSTPHASAASSIKYKIHPRSAILAQQSTVAAPSPPIRPPKPPPPFATLDNTAHPMKNSQPERASLPPRPTLHSQSESGGSPTASAPKTPPFHHPLMRLVGSAEGSPASIDGSSTSTVDTEANTVGQQQARRGERRCQSSQIV